MRPGNDGTAIAKKNVTGWVKRLDGPDQLLIIDFVKGRVDFAAALQSLRENRAARAVPDQRDSAT